MNRKTHRLFASALVAVSVCVALGLLPAARANAPDCRYEDTDDTVIDHKTKLEWRKTSMAGLGTQAFAAGVCTGLGNDFRMPTLLELSTLVDLDNQPTMDEIFGSGAVGGAFWTSTKEKMVGSYYLVIFDDGSIASSDGFSDAGVRCVRTVQ